MEAKYRAYFYSIKVIKLVNELDWRNTAAQVIAKQLIRCATSIGANIIEGQAGSSRKDFTNFINIALKSANECKYWLCLLRDCEFSDKYKVNDILNETIEIANILGASLKTLRR